MKKIVIIGQGYVGLTISDYASKTYKVVGFDSNPTIVDQLNSGVSHIEGVSSESIKTSLANGSYIATFNPKDIDQADIVVIAVPTPLNQDRKPDVRYIEAACKTIGENLTSRALIINESTSFPGTLRNLIKPAIDRFSKIKLDHLYAISPERVDPGRTDWNQKNTPRLYAGLTDAASKATKEFYSVFCDELVEVSSPEVAESAKLFENTFRQVNIALVNEFAQIAHALDISVHETLDAANTKPYGFMKFTPSAGVGGHCIPVDPTYLAYAASEKGITATFIERANEVNLNMSKYVVKRVLDDNHGTVSGKKIQVIGVSYKPDVADVRETPAQLITDELKALGALVNWHDPIVENWNGERSVELGGSEIAIVLTLHSIMDKTKIIKSAGYVFDTTGKLEGATTL